MKALYFVIFVVILAALSLLGSGHRFGTWLAGINESWGKFYEGGTMQIQPSPGTPTSKYIYRPPAGRPRGPYIVIDRYCNRLYLRTADTVLLEGICSVGSGGELLDTATGRRWRFDTPTGVYTVHSMMENPWWRKPDWAFVEEGEPIPRSESERLDNNMMGDYAIGFGDGYYVHGTIYYRLLGRSVTHGCVRLGDEDLKKLYNRTRIGMFIYVY